MKAEGSYFVAVTGGQGVGKSTFCRKLYEALKSADVQGVQVMDGLREQMDAMGIPLGSSATPQTIFAVWTAHLERQASAPEGLILLDRCVVDALAYTRALQLGTPIERRLFEQVAYLAADRLDLVVHLRLSEFFRDKGGTHETPELRAKVVNEVRTIIPHLGLRSIELDAENERAIEIACQEIQALTE
ncbi:MAG: AAA family ATPase [Sphingopyxis sp.]|nr:AAA family ATPase [Sphingopyxis sp.]